MNQLESQQKYKSISSEQATRNPTTNKKVIFYTPVQKKSQHKYFTPNRNNEHNNSWNHKNKKNQQPSVFHSMYELKVKKNQLMRSSRYQQAKQVNNVLHQLQRKRAKTQIKKLISQHKNQKKSIKKAHLRQMDKFQTLWENYFIGLKAKQQMTFGVFKKSQQRDIRFVQNQLIEKCKSLKINRGQLKSLQKKEKSLLKQQRFDDLVVLKKQKKRLKGNLLRQQQQKIYSWAKNEQDFLKTYHTKKYNTLISRIEQIHNDKYRQYQREQHRLRQKYHNVLRKLQHSQKMQINQTLEKYPNMKQLRNQRSFTLNT